METDDVDNVLIRQLSCLGTNDKEVLVRQFQQILGDGTLSQDMCAFFLDMTNWNLQDALGAYYDHGQTNNVGEMSVVDISLLDMQLVKDITIGEGESVPPSTRFVKTWRVRNNGAAHWPEGSTLCYMDGAPLTHEVRMSVGCLSPGGETDLSVEMVSPSLPGIYQSRWQLNTMQCIPFGESIWCIITVDCNGILDITQQLASAPLGGPQMHPESNPFLGPSLHNPFQDSHQLQNISMDMDINGELTSHFSQLARSSPVPINQRQGTSGPPCTPCTPPEEGNPGR